MGIEGGRDGGREGAGERGVGGWEFVQGEGGRLARASESGEIYGAWGERMR